MPHTPPLLEDAIEKVEGIELRARRYHDLGAAAKPPPLEWEEVEALRVLLRVGRDLLSLRSVLT
jgi:hypothetical protein